MKEIKIGRAKENDVVIDDISVSRNHASIIVSGDSYSVRDNASTNGTFINGRRVTGIAPLQFADILKVGNVLVPWRNYLNNNAQSNESYKTAFVPPQDQSGFQNNNAGNNWNSHQPSFAPPAQPKRSSFLKRFLIIILVLGFIGAVGIIIMQNKGYSVSALINPITRNISVSCGDVTSLLFKGTVSVTVSNNSSTNYSNVTVKVISYDSSGNNIEEKTTVFDRNLEGNSWLSKPVLVSSRAVRCEVQVLSAVEY